MSKNKTLAQHKEELLQINLKPATTKNLFDWVQKKTEIRILTKTKTKTKLPAK